jgi:hypothetical protein
MLFELSDHATAAQDGRLPVMAPRTRRLLITCLRRPGRRTAWLQRVDIIDHVDFIHPDLMIVEELWEMRRYARPLNLWFLR